ncbi:hypothetical protein LTR51_003946 [Lithohypha guttulata]|nr:hypothetical protein LTR51_003946 [Lithohypha guttulata]
MVVCKYWKQGSCRFGNSCKFEHPANTANTNTNSNNNGNNNKNRSNFGGGIFGNINRPERWHLSEEDIQNDLSKTRPQWILSAYGPGKETPAALFVDNEYSPEEVRLRFYNSQATGQGTAAADQEAVQVWQKATNDIDTVLTNVKDVQNFMEQKEKERPNRYDYCKFDGTTSLDEFIKKTEFNTQPGSSLNPWGGAVRATPTTNPFSKTPAFGQSASPFGQVSQSSGFGQTAQPSTFGQSTPISAFGKVGFGQSNTPNFGQNAFSPPQTNQPATISAFGQTSSLGQNSSSSPFVKPSASAFSGKPPLSSGFETQTAGASPFSSTGMSGTTSNASPFSSAAPTTNATSPFSSNNNNASPFGGNNKPSPFGGNNNASPFGGNNTSSPQFGRSGFGQQQQLSAPAFGRPSQPQQQPQASPFGQISQSQATPMSAPFGQQAQQPGFGQSPFGTQQQSQNQSPFGTSIPSQASQPQQGQNPSPFGQTIPAQNPFGGVQNGSMSEAPPSTVSQAGSVAQSSASKPTGKPVQPLHYSQTLPNIPPQFRPDGKLSTYRGRPVQYDQRFRPTIEGEEVLDAELPIYPRPDGKGLERVWFPQGAAEASVQRLVRALLDISLPDDQLSDTDKAEYARFFETGRFEAGRVPLVPPLRGWIDYDF